MNAQIFHCRTPKRQKNLTGKHVHKRNVYTHNSRTYKRHNKARTVRATHIRTTCATHTRHIMNIYLYTYTKKHFNTYMLKEMTQCTHTRHATHACMHMHTHTHIQTSHNTRTYKSLNAHAHNLHSHTHNARNAYNT